MNKNEELSQAIATVERQISEAKSEVAKKALNGKLERLKEELKSGAKKGTSTLATLSSARKSVRKLASKDFTALIEKLSAKPEYAFLKGYSEGKLKDDLARVAKPVGYRFVGDNTKKPTIPQIKKGLKNGTVYYEARPIRSDVSRVVQLGEGGSVSTETLDLKFYNVRGQVVESGKVIIDYDNETITLGSGKKYKVEPDREYTYRFLKTKIRAAKGIKGLSEFLKEINAPKKALNTVVRAFIDSDESKMADGGSVGKFEYKTVNTSTESGLKQAEKLKAEGWKVISSGLQTIQFERAKEKKMGTGGNIDLFEDYDNIPPQIQVILDKYSEDFEDGNYDGLGKALQEIEAEGYTFEFYVDGSAYGLRPKNVPLNQLEGYEEMAKGGNIASFNWENFTLKELNEALPTDVEIVSYDTPTEKDQRPYNAKNKKFYTNKKLTIGIGEAEISRGSENIYLEITCYDADNKSSDEYEVKIYSKENHKGLKEVANSVIEKMKHGGTTKSHDLDYYTYESAKVTISWRGKTQPFGFFKSAREAFNKINEIHQTNAEKADYVIVTPDGNLNVSDFLDKSKFAMGGGVDAKIKFRKLAKSNNFDIVVAEGRYEVELDTNDKVKSIVHPNGNRHKASECPIYNKYKKEINHYIMAKYAEGGNIDNSYLGRTQIGKSFYGWKAETSTTKKIKGYDWQITTMKRYGGELVSTATGGKSEKQDGYSTFEYSPFEDPNYSLIRSKPKMVNEKAVTKQHEEALKIFIEKMNEMSGDKMATGGGIEKYRLFNFLQDDLATLQEAIKISDKQEIERFFSYWGQHLKSLKSEANKKMFNFLSDDLATLKTAIKDNDQEEIDKFFSYWGQHLESIKYATGGKVGEKTYNVMHNVGKSKYVVNFHNGVKTYSDGSAFFDIEIFKNLKGLKAFIKKLESEGYKKQMATGGTLEDNLLPPSKTYGENLQKAMEKFDISNNEARKRYGLYTIKQWSDLLGEKMENGGEVGDISKSEIPRMQKITKLKGLYGYMPSVNTVYYDSRTDKYYFEDFEGDFMELRNISTLEQLHKFLKENNITLDKKMATGGSILDNYEGRTPEDIWNNLSKSQRQHFLYDHRSEIESYKNTGKLPSSEIIKAYNSEWSTLDKDIKNRFTNHTREGQYATGGSVDGKKYSYLPNEDISKIVLKSGQIVDNKRILDGAYVKGSKAGKKANDPEMERAMRTLEKLKSEGKLKRFYDVRGNGKKSFETIIPNKEDKGYWKRYESASRGSLGILQNELLSEEDVLNLILKTQPKLSEDKDKMANGGSVSPYIDGMTEKEIMSATVVYDNGGETLDRYTVFTPDGSVYGMSETASGFNQYAGDESEIEKGSHLGKRLKTVPTSIRLAILDRMKEEEFARGGGITNDLSGNYYSSTDFVQTHDLMDLAKETFGSSWESGGDFDYDTEEIKMLIKKLGGSYKIVYVDSENREKFEEAKEKYFPQIKTKTNDGDIFVIPTSPKGGKMAKGGNAGYTYVPNEEISKLIAKDGKEYPRTSLLDGAYITDKVRTPKMSRTQFEDDVYSYGQGGGVGKREHSLYKKFGEENPKLVNFDLDSLDEYEEMVYDDFSGKLGKARTLQIIINNTEGDYTQLSPELAEIAEEQFPSDQFGDGGNIDQMSDSEVEEKYADLLSVQILAGDIDEDDIDEENELTIKEKRSFLKEYADEDDMYAKGGGIEYQNIKKEKEKMTTELFKECGVFFAFSDKQFEENKTPLKEGEKYVSIGGGGYLPKGKVDAFMKGMKAINSYGKQKVKKGNLQESEILYELQNHECFYTGDISDVVDLFEGTYTVKQIRDVYNKHREANQEYALGGEITAEEREKALKNYPKLNL